MNDTLKQAPDEAELQTKARGDRVTAEAVEAFIREEHYFSAAEAAGVPAHPELKLMTICVLVLDNGFTVLGQSACADPANFDPEIGMRLARADAKNKIWAFLGFELRSKKAYKDRA